MTPDIIPGDPVWQKIAAGLAIVFLLWHVRDGYRYGAGRKLFGLLALAVAWAGAFFLNDWLAGILQHMIPYPQLLLRAMAGVLIAVALYFGVSGLRGVFFPFGEYENKSHSRLLGTFVGALIGLLWIGVIWTAVRFTATFAQCAMQGKPQPIAESYREHPMIARLIKLKASLDLGEAGVIAQKLDPVPASIYRLSEKSMRLMSSPEACQALGQDPSIQVLMQHEKVVALTEDPEVNQLVREHNVNALLQHPKLRAVADDKALQAQVVQIDFEAAIDRALAKAETQVVYEETITVEVNPAGASL